MCTVERELLRLCLCILSHNKKSSETEAEGFIRRELFTYLFLPVFSWRGLQWEKSAVMEFTPTSGRLPLPPPPYPRRLCLHCSAQLRPNVLSV